jgi:hypothetical protein
VWTGAFFWEEYQRLTTTNEGGTEGQRDRLCVCSIALPWPKVYHEAGFHLAFLYPRGTETR